jgi:hypothetical protein
LPGSFYLPEFIVSINVYGKKRKPSASLIARSPQWLNNVDRSAACSGRPDGVEHLKSFNQMREIGQGCQIIQYITVFVRASLLSLLCNTEK